jgi:hypothetical protein
MCPNSLNWLPFAARIKWINLIYAEQLYRILRALSFDGKAPTTRVKAKTFQSGLSNGF